MRTHGADEQPASENQRNLHMAPKKIDQGYGENEGSPCDYAEEIEHCSGVQPGPPVQLRGRRGFSRLRTQYQRHNGKV